MSKNDAPASPSSSSVLVDRPLPTIACIDHSRALADDVFPRLVAALQRYVDDFVCPVWGTPARLVQSDRAIDGAWELLFLDGPDHLPYALHDVTAGGLPLAKAYVRTSERDGVPISAAASHELVEMLVDPSVNLMARVPGANPPVMYCYEVADPVDAHHFDVDGFAMSDFVYPTYFEHFHRPGSVRFDHRGVIEEPFGVAPGGYQNVFVEGEWRVWPEETSPSTVPRATRDRRGRRGAQRTRTPVPH